MRAYVLACRETRGHGGVAWLAIRKGSYVQRLLQVWRRRIWRDRNGWVQSTRNGKIVAGKGIGDGVRFARNVIDTKIDIMFDEDIDREFEERVVRRSGFHGVEHIDSIGVVCVDGYAANVEWQSRGPV
jgi:hypothetical protein